MKVKLSDKWKEAKLEEITKVDSGQGAPQGENWFNGDSIFVRARDLNKLSEGVFVGDHCEKITDEAIKKYSLTLYPKTSVVFPKSGMSIATENIAILKYDSYVVNHLAIIETEDLIDSKYVFYFLKKLKILNLVRNSSYPSIRISDIKNLKILWPSREVRREIVSILEKAEKLKEIRDEADRLTKDFLRAVFLEMFGKFIFNKKTHTQPLKNVLMRIDSGSSPVCEPYPRITPDQIAVLKLGSVTYGFFNPDENKYLPPETKIKKKVSVKKNDLLFSRKNTYDLVGATAFVFESDKNLLLPDTIFKLVYDEDKINGIYLWKLLSEPNFKKQVENLATGSAGSMPNISKERLMKFEIPIPPMDLQIKFAEIVQSVEHMKKYQKYSKEYLDDIFNALIQKAFKGELAC